MAKEDRFLSIAEARAASGLRMACLRGIPSPWTEAAKGIFRVKGLDCQYAGQAETDAESAVAAWAGDSSVPVVAYNREALRTGWVEILVLAERLAPEPALIPGDARARALFFGLAHEIVGEMGLGWCQRLLILKGSLDHSGEPGTTSSAGRLAGKYGLIPAHVRVAEDRVVEVLGLLDTELGDQDYFFPGQLTALDIYWATMANLLTPLPEDQLPMGERMRAVYATDNERVLGALTARLRAHQERIYRDHLELPVPL